MADVTTRSPEALHRPLRERWEYLHSWWQKTHPWGPEVKLSTTYRDRDDQEREHREGQGVKWGQSLHNYDPAYAFDFYFEDDGEAVWDRWEWYQEFGEMAKSLGLIWGGDWTSRDGPHVQMPMTFFDALDARVPELTPLPAEEYGWAVVVHLDRDVQQTIPIPEGHDVITRVDVGRKRVYVDIRLDE